MAKKAASERTRQADKKPAHSRADTAQWTARQMKKNPDASMTDLKKLGVAAGYHIYPLIIGLARKELGWSRPKKKATRRKAKARVGARRGPGRPRKADNPAAAIQAVITRMNDLEREAATLRAALGKIADIASRA